jgi:hypothetical protein
MRGRTIRTPEKRKAFLEELAIQEGDVSAAALAVGVGRRSMYDWREHDEDFAAEWDDVIGASTEKLEREAYRRAYEGVEEPVYYQGKVVGYVMKKSDTLLMFTLKARKPDKYRENSKLELGGVDGGPIKIEVEFVNEKPQET